MLILREEYKWLKLRSELTTTKVSYECDDFVGAQFGTMGPRLVPEQHTVAPNMKFLVPGLAYKFYFSYTKMHN